MKKKLETWNKQVSQITKFSKKICQQLYSYSNWSIINEHIQTNRLVQ